MESLDNISSIIDDAFLVKEADEFLGKIPRHFNDIQKSPQKEKWLSAVDKELNSLQDLKAFKIVPLSDVPAGKQILDTTWVFTIKDQDPNDIIFKARLCVRGDKDTTQFETADIYAGVARLENFKLLLTIASSQGYYIVAVDYNTAFLNAYLKKKVYIKIPLGFLGASRRTHCLLVEKALYGLHEAPAAWNDELATTNESLGFKRMVKDWNLYVKRSQDSVVIMGYHVDDGLIISNSKDKITHVIQSLQTKYKMKVNHSLTRFLNINIHQKDGFYLLDQNHYISDCASKFKLLDTKPISSPLDSGFVWHIIPDDKQLSASTPYRALIGCLLSIARVTRPDVLYATSVLAKCAASPTTRHWNAAKRVLTYLYHSRYYQIKLGSNSDEIILDCFTDSTWADDIHNRRSRSGGIIRVNGSLISSWSKQQLSVALSSMEAEHQAMCLGSQEIVYYRDLLAELGYPQNKPTVLYCDNKSALDLLVSSKNHPKVKHIAIKFYFTRECIQNGLIHGQYVPTSDQLADGFTKALSGAKLNSFLSSIGIVRNSGGVLE
jgi:hypothetical protein